MMIPHVVLTEADKVFVNIYNAQAVALASGDAVVWSTTAPDGCKTIQPTTALLSLFVGLADGAIAASAYGLAQAYGYRSAVLVTNTTDTAVAAGDILVPVNAADYLATVARLATARPVSCSLARLWRPTLPPLRRSSRSASAPCKA